MNRNPVDVTKRTIGQPKKLLWQVEMRWVSPQADVHSVLSSFISITGSQPPPR